jgi:hypothetical protein
MEKPYSGYATLTETNNGMEIIIPARKNWFVIIFLGAWLGGWAVGEVVAIGFLLGIIGGDAGAARFFILFWLLGWSAGGFFAFRVFLWTAMGKEIINIGQGEIQVFKKGLLLSKPKIYNLTDAKKFRVQEENNNYGAFGYGGKNNLAMLGNSGTIRFDYGLKTVKFASGIDDAEAHYILDNLKAIRILSDQNFA